MEKSIRRRVSECLGYQCFVIDSDNRIPGIFYAVDGLPDWRCYGLKAPDGRVCNRLNYRNEPKPIVCENEEDVFITEYEKQKGACDILIEKMEADDYVLSFNHTTGCAWTIKANKVTPLVDGGIEENCDSLNNDYCLAVCNLFLHIYEQKD